MLAGRGQLTLVSNQSHTTIVLQRIIAFPVSGLVFVYLTIYFQIRYLCGRHIPFNDLDIGVSSRGARGQCIVTDRRAVRFTGL